eukprot:Ihof_evm6s26 gene=Ihof_evmTU6s26
MNVDFEPCIALYNYKPKYQHDVELREGSTVHVFEKADEEENVEWWKVRTEDGIEGYVPASYLYVIPSEPREEYEYSDQHDIDQDLYCLLCKNILDSPVHHVVCGGSVCAYCLWKADKKCPHCKNTVDWAKETKDASKELLDKIGDIKVKCPNCEETCPRYFLPEHREKYCLIDCPEGCGLQFTRTEMEKHLGNECLKIEMSCPGQNVGCTQRLLRAEMSLHMTTCPYIVLQPTLLAHQEQIQSLTTQ